MKKRHKKKRTYLVSICLDKVFGHVTTEAYKINENHINKIAKDLKNMTGSKNDVVILSICEI